MERRVTMASSPDLVSPTASEACSDPGMLAKQVSVGAVSLLQAFFFTSYTIFYIELLLRILCYSEFKLCGRI
jgi:hypothetical protein